MKVINWKPYNKGKLRGFFDVLTAEGFTLKSFKIMDSINGEFVSNPSQQDKDGEYYDTVWTNKETKDKLFEMVEKERAKESNEYTKEQPEGTREQAESLTTKTSDDIKQETDEVIPF